VREEANEDICLVQSRRVLTPTRRTMCSPDGTPASSATSWMASRGVPIPTSTSGQTGTQSTKRRRWTPETHHACDRRHSGPLRRGDNARCRCAADHDGEAHVIVCTLKALDGIDLRR
jgi:hypothetical protein